MKKILSVIAAFLVLAMLFAGCAKTSGPAVPEKPEETAKTGIADLLSKAAKLLESEDYNGAAEAYLEALEADETNEDAVLGAAEAYIRSDKFDSAKDILAGFLEKLPTAEKVKKRAEELESGVIKDSEGKIRRYDFYDEGVFQAYHVYDYNGDEMCKVSRYDPDGKLLEYLDTGMDGNTYISYQYNTTDGELSKVVHIYDEDIPDRIIKTFYGEGEDVMLDIYEYDEDGRNIFCTTYYGEEEDEDNLFELAEFIYDEEDRVQFQKDYYPDGRLCWYVEHIYDDDGHLVRDDYYDENDDMYMYTEHYFDENGNGTGSNTIILD